MVSSGQGGAASGPVSEMAVDLVQGDPSAEDLLADVEDAANEAADRLAEKNPRGKVGHSLSSFGFSLQGSPQRLFHLHLFLYSVFTSVTPATAMSSLTASIQYYLVSLYCIIFTPLCRPIADNIVTREFMMHNSCNIMYI